MSDQPYNNPFQVEERSLRSLFTRAFAKSRPGSPNLSNLSIYAFGLSGVWTGIGAGILPFKVIEALELGGISVLAMLYDRCPHRTSYVFVCCVAPLSLISL